MAHGLVGVLIETKHAVIEVRSNGNPTSIHPRCTQFGFTTDSQCG